MQRVDRGLGHFNVLLDGTRAGAYRADDLVIKEDRDTAAEDDDLPGIALSDAEQCGAGLRQVRQQLGGLREDPRGGGLVDRQVNAPDEGIVLSCERNEVATGIDNRDVVCDANAGSRVLGGVQHVPGVIERQRAVSARHIGKPRLRLDRGFDAACSASSHDLIRTMGLLEIARKTP